jgi:hypothetical protein
MARTQGAASPSLQAPRKQALFQGLMIASVPLRGAAANGARERIAAGQACRVGAELSTESRQRVQRVPEAACAAFRPRPSVFTPHGSGWFGGAFPLLWERTLFSPTPPRYGAEILERFVPGRAISANLYSQRHFLLFCASAHGPCFSG